MVDEELPHCAYGGELRAVSRIHYRPKTISIRGPDGQSTEVEPQYGCYTFAFQQSFPSPVTTSKNKWPRDWASYWFYHKVPLDPETESHPLVVKEIELLEEPRVVEVDEKSEHEALIVMLHEVSKVFGT